MTLAEWMALTQTSDAAMAKAIGVSKSIVTRYRNGLIRPRWPVLDEIVRVTNGAVMPNDFLSASPYLTWPPVRAAGQAFDQAS